MDKKIRGFLDEFCENKSSTLFDENKFKLMTLWPKYFLNKQAYLMKFKFLIIYLISPFRVDSIISQKISYMYKQNTEKLVNTAKNDVAKD